MHQTPFGGAINARAAKAYTDAGLDSVAAKGIKKGQKPLPENTPVSPGYIVVLGDKLRKIVRDGKF